MNYDYDSAIVDPKEHLLNAIVSLWRDAEQSGWLRFKHRQVCSNPVDVCKCQLAWEYQQLQRELINARDDILHYAK